MVRHRDKYEGKGGGDRQKEGEMEKPRRAGREKCEGAQEGEG